MYKIIVRIILAGGLIAIYPSAQAQDEESGMDDDGAVRCIDVRSIRRTYVVDDRSVLFYMGRRRVFYNILPSRCAGLASEDRFTYTTTTTRLCDVDVISVLYNDIGGLRGGPACRLGLFHEITREDAKALRAGTHLGPQPKPLPVPEPEEIGVDKESEPEETGSLD